MRNSARLLAPVALLALAGNAPAADYVAKARTVLEDSLVNYEGAKVRKMRLVHAADGRAAYCGEVNAPNRAGGMTGWLKTAVIVEGRGYTKIVQLAPDGFSGLRDYMALCPYDLDKEAYEDASASLSPAASRS